MIFYKLNSISTTLTCKFYEVDEIGDYQIIQLFLLDKKSDTVSNNWDTEWYYCFNKELFFFYIFILWVIGEIVVDFLSEN